VMCVIKHSVRSLIWRNISLYTVASVHLPVMCVIKHSVRSLIWRNISLYTVASVHLPVMCVIKHSVRSLIWRNISLYTVASVHLPVMCVIKHSVKSITWINTSLYIVASVRMPVLCVIKHSVSFDWRHPDVLKFSTKIIKYQTPHALLCVRLHVLVLKWPSSGLFANQVNRCWLHVGIRTMFTIHTGLLCLLDKCIKFKTKKLKNGN